MTVSLMRAAAVAAAVVACVLAIGAAVRMQWPTCSDVVRRTPRETLGAIVGRTVVVTGGTSGIGRCLSTTFARLGARVIVGGRDARASVEGARVWPLDLTSSQSVDAFAAAVSRERPSLVVFNAGMFPADAMQLVEATGIERCFAANHVGHFQLARAVRASLAADARFVFVASGSQRGPLSLDDAASAEQWRRVARPYAGEYSALRAYGSSKLANALCARYFHLLGIDSRAVSPGALIGTGISRHRSALERFVFRHVISHFTMSADQGAAGVLWVCLQPGLSGRCIEHSRSLPDVSDAAAVALATVTGELLPQKNVGQGAEEA
jgi:NAD(P)-dependent dehydrogenase (short-subunit alcohol dehydrogenase family)